MLQACNVQPYGCSWPQRATSVVLAHRRPRCPAARRVAQAGRRTHACMRRRAAAAAAAWSRSDWSVARRGALLPPRESVTRERVAVHACTHWQVEWQWQCEMSGDWRSAGAGRGAMRFGQVRVAVGRAQPRRSLCSPAPWPGTAGNCEPASMPNPTPTPTSPCQ